MLGRMVATMRFATVAMAPTGSVLAGALGEVAGVRAGLLTIGAASVCTVLATAFLSRLHKVKD
jgi:hypothetical protein